MTEMSEATLAVIDKCKDATLLINYSEEKERFLTYGMRLELPDEDKTVLSIGLLISGMHKWTRQHKSSETMFLLGSFYVALNKFPQHHEDSKFNINVTKVGNRIIITLLEELAWQTLDIDGRKEVLCLLGKIEVKRAERLYLEVLGYVHRIISIIDISDRARLISLVRNHAVYDQECVTVEEYNICKRMKEEAEAGQIISLDFVKQSVKKSMPEFYGIFDDIFKIVHKNKEFRRVLNMCCICDNLIPSHMRAQLSHVEAMVIAKFPEKNFIQDSGWKDQHTNGVSEKAMQTWTNIGCVTRTDQPINFGHKTQFQMHVFYTKMKAEEFFKKTEEKKKIMETHKKLKDLATCQSDKKRKSELKANTSFLHIDENLFLKLRQNAKQRKLDKNNFDLIQENLGINANAIHLDNDGETVMQDCQVVDFTKDSNLLGFRRATTCGVLLVDLHDKNFKIGDRIFVKIGESEDVNMFSNLVYKCMKQIGMVHVNVCSKNVLFTECKWKKLGDNTDIRNGTTWCNSMLYGGLDKTGEQKNGGVMSMVRQQNGQVHMQICSEFPDSIRLSYLKQSNHYKVMCKQKFGKTLTQAFFLSKAIGGLDFGPFNCVVNAKGEVMVVDFSCAGQTRMEIYKTKGLHTSNRWWDPDFTKMMIDYIQDNRQEIVDFIKQLLIFAPINKYLVFDKNCPFFTNTYDMFEQGAGKEPNTPYMKWLINEIGRNTKIKKTEPNQGFTPWLI